MCYSLQLLTTQKQKGNERSRLQSPFWPRLWFSPMLGTSAAGCPAWKAFLLTLVCGLLISCRQPGATIVPAIEFSKVPQAEVGGPDKVQTIEGRVIGARAGQRIVLFAKSGQWWVQPSAKQPFTEIRPDSTWTNSTHLGTEYAAVLVEPEYVPPATTDKLPGRGSAVVAVVAAQGEGFKPADSKILHFSGYEWDVRQIPSPRGGTSNVYDPANAWTDAKGRLHLRIARTGAQTGAQIIEGWSCAEVSLRRSLGYGSYLFVVQELSHLEPAAVLGMYTWDDLNADQNHREMDIEISRWGDPVSKNAQYVIQPYYVPVNAFRFLTPPGVLTHSFHWEPGRVSFKCLQDRGGHGFEMGAQSRVIAEHEFSSGIPSPGKETVHISFYVYGKARSPLQNEAEVVIEKFEHLP